MCVINICPVVNLNELTDYVWVVIIPGKMYVAHKQNNKIYTNDSNMSTSIFYKSNGIKSYLGQFFEHMENILFYIEYNESILDQ